MGAGEDILKRLDVIERKLDQLLASGGPGRAPQASGGNVASDADLDGQYGSPDVKFSPKRWTGFDFKGRPMSQCSSEFLDVYAEALQYSSEHPKPGREKYAQYDARDATRARGWAARNRGRAVDTSNELGAETPADPLGEAPLPF